MSAKHKVTTLAPTSFGVGSPKELQRGSNPAPASSSKKGVNVGGMDEDFLIAKVIAGAKKSKEGGFPASSLVILNAMTAEMDRRKLWETAYEQLVIELFPDTLDKTIHKAFDDMSKDLYLKSPDMERFIVLNSEVWEESVNNLNAVK